MSRPPLSGSVSSPWGDESGLAHTVLDWASDRAVHPGDPKTTARPASALRREVGTTITPRGIGAQRALSVFAEVLAPATRAQDDPMNLAYIPSAPTRAAVAFDVATSAANIFGGLWEAGAGAIFAENEALGWLISLVRWPPSAAGTFVAGGTMGNLSALHAARSAARYRRQARGLPPRPTGGWILACAESAHPSIRNAAQVLDDLDGVSDVCGEHGAWLHVDGAYGGAALCAGSVRDRFVGIERADSLIVDPHKWLFAPYDCCALLYRDAVQARAAHTQTASYLDVVDREEPNPSDLAIHLSRRVRGLPFWFSLAVHGTDRYREAVECTLTTARDVAAAIRGSPRLSLVRDPDLTVLLFERDGWDAARYRAWSREQALAGTILCLPTTWRGRTVLRLAFVNPQTRAGDVMKVLDAMPD